MHTTNHTYVKPTPAGSKRPTLRLAKPPTSPIVPSFGYKVSIRFPRSENLVPHPETRHPIFGFVPSLPFLTGTDDQIPVVLSKGYQSEDGRGMGAAHAWDGHQKDIEALGGQSADDTALLVARVITEGTPIYYEEGYRSKTKVVAHLPGVGSVILGLFKFGWYRRWQVITAHGGKGYLGTCVGEIAGFSIKNLIY
jgi:hypothetical protein